MKIMDININKLSAKIQEAYPWTTDEAAKARAERLVKHISDNLAVNVVEWLEGKEISDVWVGDYCVKMVMEIRGDHQFLEAIEALVLYDEDEKEGLREIWKTRK